MGAEIGDLDVGAAASDSAAMILTCPECATSYFADDSAIGSGRVVRCASCNASWRAEPAPPLELKAAAPQDRPAAEEPPPDDRELFEAPPSELPGEVLPKAFRAKAETDRRTREAAVQGVIWAGMGAAFAVLIGAGVVFRSDVVRVWPRSASAYASVGLTVNPVGVTIEEVRFQHTLQDGHPALVVTGVLRNIRPRKVTAPPLQIQVLNRQGQALVTRIAQVRDPDLEPGQTRSFSVSLLDPPMFASDLDLTFVREEAAPKLRSRPIVEALPPSPQAEQAPALPRAMSLGAPIPEAKPLPAGSPYALTPPKT
jgi:predicted Zn finger-like uncharacterized protein